MTVTAFTITARFPLGARRCDVGSVPLNLAIVLEHGSRSEQGING